MGFTPQICWKLVPPRRLTLHSIPRVRQFKVCPTRRFTHSAFTEKPLADELRYPSILRPLLFSIGISGSAFALAAYWTNRDTEKWTAALSRAKSWGHLYAAPTSDDLKRARQHQLFTTLKGGLDNAEAFFGESSNYVSKLALYAYSMCAQKWVNATEGRRVCRMIIALNAVIWLGWQIPRLRPIMNRHFLHYPLSGLSHTLVTSVFSHKNFLHFLFNSMALSGFGSTVALYFTIQQHQSPTRLLESTSQYHFVSFFISAGLFSSLVSHVVRVRFYYPRLLSKLSSQEMATSTVAANIASDTAKVAATIPQILPSLGASGAIWACVSISALAFPDARLSLVLPTSFSVPIQAGTASLVALDVLGIIRGWRLFDHWAHLGGAVFGALYYFYGPRLWDAARLHTVPPRTR